MRFSPLLLCVVLISPHSEISAHAVSQKERRIIENEKTGVTTPNKYQTVHTYIWCFPSPIEWPRIPSLLEVRFFSLLLWLVLLLPSPFRVVLRSTHFHWVLLPSLLFKWCCFLLFGCSCFSSQRCFPSHFGRCGCHCLPPLGGVVGAAFISSQHNTSTKTGARNTRTSTNN